MHSSFFFSPLKIKIFEILLPDNVIIESWLWPSFFHITKSHFLTQYTHFTCKPIVKNVTASATGIKPTSPLQSDNPEQHIFQQKWGRWRDQALKSLPPLIRAHTQWMICSDPGGLRTTCGPYTSCWVFWGWQSPYISKVMFIALISHQKWH